MNSTNQERRAFLWMVPAAALAAGAARAATPAAPAAPMVDEKDPAATGLGYVADAARIDKARFKQYAAGQQCTSCQLYGGAAGSANGPCPIYPGKSVAAKGWCSAYVKKA